jgi:hypothetical protein
MADAYRCASEGLYSPEIDKLSKIDRFGLEAITGRRVFYFGELRALETAERIMTAYASRARAQDWATWVKDHPGLANLLFEAERQCQS